jgi:hypothetical protein
MLIAPSAAVWRREKSGAGMRKIEMERRGRT